MNERWHPPISLRRAVRIGAFFLCLNGIGAAQDTKQESNISGNNNTVVQIIGGKTPNELREISESAVKLAQLSKDSGIAIAVLQRFFMDVNEANVSPENWPAKLTEIATRYNELRTQLAERSSSSAASAALRDQARAALDAGQFDVAENLLGQSKQLNLTAVARLDSEKDKVLNEAAVDAGAQGSAALLRYDFAAAAKYFTEALGLAKRSGDRAKQMRFAYKAGQSFYEADELEKALAPATEGVALRKEITDTEISECATLTSLAWIQAALLQFGSGMRSYQACLNTFEGRPLEYLRELDNYAFFLKQNHNPELALIAQQKAVAIAKSLPTISIDDHAKLLCNLGDTYLDLEQYELARQTLTEATNFDDGRSDHVGTHRWVCLHNLGTSYGYLERYEKADAILKSALAFALEYYGERGSVAITLWQLGWVNENWYKMDEARNYYHRALEIWERPPVQRQRAAMATAKLAKLAPGPLGVVVRPLSADLKKQKGRQSPSGWEILFVEHDGVAANAGLMRGDIIVTVDGKTVSSMKDDLRTYIKSKKAGSDCSLKVKRGDAWLTITLPNL
ncbi:tetratricopeptide repeat protein [Bradyrhizobium commune]|uniref:Tetratricopeptide repeat protein n=1 Tax=Bradyrhizobium commune TaxID=83627 RepID=A0A7S9GZJ3_9BRAD|nr:tetratricopeptide repeat protein [Bradyrhizobium commune]QPF90976.1 tetratricopeptide repeat protein [Bradyrhizobium commune]